MSRSSRLAALAVLALSLTVSACAGGDEVTDDDVAEDLSTELQDGPTGLSADDADCVAESLVEQLGADELADVDFAADEPPEADREELAAAVQQALGDCEIDLSAAAP